MQAEKIINEDGSVIYILKKHKKEIYRCMIPKDNLHYKLRLITEFENRKRENPDNIPFEEKELLSALCKVDKQFQNQYEIAFGRGGVRKGAGRKVGSKSRTPKTKRTERLNRAITQEEKELLIDFLNNYRLKHN